MANWQNITFPIMLFDGETRWINETTKLNESNMNTLSNRVANIAGALRDPNDSSDGVIPNLVEARMTVYGDGGVHTVGLTEYISNLNDYVFGKYKWSVGESYISSEISAYLSTAVSEQDIIEGSYARDGAYGDWGVSDFSLSRLAGHKGIAVSVYKNFKQSSINKERLDAFEKVYRPQAIEFKDKFDSTTSNCNVRLCYSKNDDTEQLRLTAPELIIHKDAASDYLSITTDSGNGVITAHNKDNGKTSFNVGSVSHPFNKLYVGNINDAGSSLSIGSAVTIKDKLTVESNGASITGNAVINGNITVDKILNGTADSISIYPKVTVDNSVEVTQTLTAKEARVTEQPDENDAVINRSTLNNKVSIITGNSTDSMLDSDGLVDDKSVPTLYSLKNAVKHYAITWQAM